MKAAGVEVRPDFQEGAPAKMRAIMQYRRVAPIRLPAKVAQVSEPCAREMTSPPTTPSAAA